MKVKRAEITCKTSEAARNVMLSYHHLKSQFVHSHVAAHQTNIKEVDIMSYDQGHP